MQAILQKNSDFFKKKSQEIWRKTQDLAISELEIVAEKRPKKSLLKSFTVLLTASPHYRPEEEEEEDGVEAPLFPAACLSDLGETLAELRPAAAGAALPDFTEVTEPDLSRGDKLELRLDDRELAGLDLALPGENNKN